MQIDSGAILAIFGVAVMCILAIIFFLRKCIPDCRERRKVSKTSSRKAARIENIIKREIDLESGCSEGSDSRSGSGVGVEKDGMGAWVDFLEKRQDVLVKEPSAVQRVPDLKTVSGDDGVGPMTPAFEAAIVQWEKAIPVGVNHELPDGGGESDSNYTVDKSGQDETSEIQDSSPKTVPQVARKVNSHDTLSIDLGSPQQARVMLDEWERGKW